MSKIVLERVQKLISQAGFCSRRKAESFIIAGKVKVNGKIITLGDKASFKDDIKINGVPIFKQDHIYYLLNKPEKTITSLKDERNRQTVIDLIDTKAYIFPVGRLDYNTTGTLILTNDGELTNRLTHPSFQVSRVYRTRLNRPLTDVELKFLNSENVMIDEKKSMQNVTKVDNKSYVVNLKEGRYHHVKRIFELVDAEVQSLNRIEYAGISHIGLKKGEYRMLKQNEINWLKNLK